MQMLFQILVCYISLSSVAANDAVSLIQRSGAQAFSIRTPKPRSPAQPPRRKEEPSYPMTWHVNSMKDLQYNNIGGVGPILTDPQEMRFRNVSWLHTAAGDIELDLRITSIGTYHRHAKLSQQGVSGEFGVLYAKRKKAQRLLFELVHMGTNTLAKVSEFDFTVLDMDESGEGEYCTTTVAMWGADGYYINPTAFHHMHVSAQDHWHDHLGAIVACSNVTVKDGQVGNPTTVNQISQQQARASIVYHFKDIGEFQLGLHFQKLRQVSFVGADNPLVWAGVLWHHVFTPIDPPELDNETQGQIYGWTWTNSSHNDWAVDQDSEVVHNNLGGRGPVFTDPPEIRYSNVGQLKTYDEGEYVKKEWLDLVVILEEQYWGSEFINSNWNGANGEYGEIGLDRRSEGTFVFTFVYHGTNRSAVSPYHDFIIFDIDNMADPTLGEEYTIYGASKYWIRDDSWVLVNDSIPGEIRLTSNVMVQDGAIPNPTSWANLTDDQLRVSCQFEFQNTATWRVKFKTTATTQRAFLFAGTSDPPLPDYVAPIPIATAAPTAFPTSMPTPPPTPVPTESPTESPTTAAPTATPTESPTQSPTTATPTAAPTAAPTASPTVSPTVSPTESPTTAAPTGSPTAPPTASPTTGSRGGPVTTLAPFIMPTASPTASPTTLPRGGPVTTLAPFIQPTASPTASPTIQPRGGPVTTLAPFIQPTVSPTASPTIQPRGGPVTTLAPFIQPTASPTAPPPTLFGDPHIRNMEGERFDINRAGTHTFLLIPRDAKGRRIQLQLRGSITPRGDSCSGQLYLTHFAVSGQWLRSVGSVELSTVGAEFDAPEAIGLKVGRSGNLSVEDFRSKLSTKMANVTQLHPMRPTKLNTHVTTLLVRLYLGPTILRFAWEHQKEKVGYSNSMMLLTYGLGNVEGEVGGLLGRDDHKWAATRPDECHENEAGQSSLLKQPASCCVRAQVSQGAADDDL